MNNFVIKNALIENANKMFYIESACFPECEAASLKAIKKRIIYFNEVCLVGILNNEIIGYVNGAISNSEIIEDDFFESMKERKQSDNNVLIFSLAVHPDFQRKGFGKKLLDFLIIQSKKNKKEKLILTCKEKKIEYYKSFGFVNLGVSISEHGGEKWYNMEFLLNE